MEGSLAVRADKEVSHFSGSYSFASHRQSSDREIHFHSATLRLRHCRETFESRFYGQLTGDDIDLVASSLIKQRSREMRVLSSAAAGQTKVNLSGNWCFSSLKLSQSIKSLFGSKSPLVKLITFSNENEFICRVSLRVCVWVYVRVCGSIFFFFVQRFS